MTKISVIVPVYNCENYLNRCLDGSPSICDKYAEKDSRFTVIHQKNCGVSVARTAGINACTGEWIAFVDSDDWYEPSMLEDMFNAIRSSGGGMI